MISEPFCLMDFGIGSLIMFLYQVNLLQDKGIYVGGDILEKLNV